MTRSERQAKTYQDWKARQLKDPAFRQAFESGLDWLRLGASVAILRGQMKLSQAELASLAHTSQPVISRLEGGQNVQLETVHRVAQALGVRIRIELISPKQGAKAHSRKPHSVKRVRVTSAA